MIVVSTCTNCCYNDGRRAQSPKTCRMPASSHCIRTRETTVTAASLLSVAKVLLYRFQSLTKHVYPKAQCGFKAGRSTINMIFSIKQLQEKCCEQRMLLFIAFIDLTKAFDLVSGTGLLTMLQRIGYSHTKLLRMIIFH